MFARQTRGHNSVNQEITVIITRRTKLRNRNSFRVVHNNGEVIICNARPQRMSDMRQCTKRRLSKKQKHQN